MSAEHANRDPEEVSLSVQFWPTLTAMTHLVGGLRSSTRMLLWSLWLLMVGATCLQHRSWAELLWPAGMLVLGRTWRWWFVLPSLWLRLRRTWPRVEITYRLRLADDSVVALFPAESLLLKSPGFNRRTLRNRLLVFSPVPGMPLLSIAKAEIPAAWPEKLEHQLEEKDLPAPRTAPSFRSDSGA